MNLELLEELKRKLQQEAELAPVWIYFLDHFGENPAFIALGERINHNFVEAVIAQVALQLYGDGCAIRNMILTRMPDRPFVHGGFSIDGRIGGVIYFEDAHIGLVTVTELPPSIDVRYARFSGQPLRKLPVPSNN